MRDLFECESAGCFDFAPYNALTTEFESVQLCAECLGYFKGRGIVFMPDCTCQVWYANADTDEGREDDGHDHRDDRDGCTAPGCACEYSEPRMR
jgi:hypothetical protein